MSISKLNVLYLCPLGQQHQQWRLDAAPAGLNVIMRRNPAKAELLALIPQADVLISERSGVIDREIIAAGARLRLIQRIGSLVHDIDLQAARELGVPVAARPIVGTIAVAEHVMTQMLAVLRRVMPEQLILRQPPEQFIGGPARRTTEDVFCFNWSRQSKVSLLYGKTVGILGFGEIGAELARRLAGWQCRVLYTKRAQLPPHIEQSFNIVYHEPEALLRESDIVVCLLPYFPETDYWLNAARIAMMKRGAVLVEAGSGSVVDEQAVADALEQGHLSGAAFDTYEWEPIRPDNPLLQFIERTPGANVLLTPHIGSCNDVSAGEFAEFYDNALRVLRGEPLVGIVNSAPGECV